MAAPEPALPETARHQRRHEVGVEDALHDHRREAPLAGDLGVGVVVVAAVGRGQAELGRQQVRLILDQLDRRRLGRRELPVRALLATGVDDEALRLPVQERHVGAAAGAGSSVGARQDHLIDDDVAVPARVALSDHGPGEAARADRDRFVKVPLLAAVERAGDGAPVG